MELISNKIIILNQLEICYFCSVMGNDSWIICDTTALGWGVQDIYLVETDKKGAKHLNIGTPLCSLVKKYSSGWTRLM